MAKIGFKTQVLRRSWHIGDRFLLFRRAVLISFPLWPFSSDGSGPMPGPRRVFFGRPGARLLEKGPSPGRPGARLLGKGRKFWAFWLLYIVKFQGPSRPDIHTWKPWLSPCPTLQSPGFSLAWLFRPRPITSAVGKTDILIYNVLHYNFYLIYMSNDTAKYG